ncbi:MAG TPA: DUF92 domain-containing protein [Ktedonobacteraceae bacterium]|jgi:uncharacterized protein (TIGR00297 family)|nr:DUF92 domain-containing protein [Ktedonobacteraceae bacterium]
MALFSQNQWPTVYRKTTIGQDNVSPTLLRLLAGLLFSSGIGIVARKRHSLTSSGVVGAITTGTTTVGLGGWSWGLTLIFFFVSSSLLSHWKSAQKEQTASDKFSKGSQRDLVQVAANGGIATLLALGHGLSSSRALRDTLEAGYVGALAVATGDTWATELGVLSPQQPRLITTGQPTTPGTSGGITPLGTGAAALGSLALGTCFWLLKRSKSTSRAMPLLALISGLFGCLGDSLLGATIQAMYYCPACDKETERRIHNCGTPTRQLRGWRWMNNDAVNLLATLVGSLLAMLLQQISKRPFGRIKIEA